MKIATALLAASLALPAFAAENPLIEQGRAALNQGDGKRAAEILEKAVAQQPNNSEAHFLLGRAYGNLAQNANIFSQASLAKKTKAEFERAVQLDANNFEARIGLIQYYKMAPGIMGGSDEKAVQEANELKKRDALYGHQAWAIIHRHDKKPDLAHQEYVNFVKEQPSSPISHYWLAVDFLGMNDFKSATQEFETVIKVDPNYMPGWFQIGHMAALNGNDFARGEASLRKYLAYTPKSNEPSLARAHYWLGQIYEKQGKKNEAKQAYATSLRLNPTQKDAQEALRRVS